MAEVEIQQLDSCLKCCSFAKLKTSIKRMGLTLLVLERFEGTQGSKEPKVYCFKLKILTINIMLSLRNGLTIVPW